MRAYYFRAKCLCVTASSISCFSLSSPFVQSLYAELLQLDRSVDDIHAELIQIKLRVEHQFDRVSERLRDTMNSIRMIAVLANNLRNEANTAYDRENEQHEAQLMRLWELLMPEQKLTARISKDWDAIGFQGRDPATDFRGMGILGLNNLVAFVESSPYAAEVVRMSRLSPGFPLSITGINVTMLILEALEAKHLHNYFFVHGESRDSFERLYGVIFYQFALNYTNSNPVDIRDFPPVFNALKARATIHSYELYNQ
jgi:hypothetical protein